MLVKSSHDRVIGIDFSASSDPTHLARVQHCVTQTCSDKNADYFVPSIPVRAAAGDCCKCSKLGSTQRPHPGQPSRPAAKLAEGLQSCVSPHPERLLPSLYPSPCPLLPVHRVCPPLCSSPSILFSAHASPSSSILSFVPPLLTLPYSATVENFSMAGTTAVM
ncbi:unnamed protein product [Schistocephalus solidus]|uniref:Uncharacterized protein n=1 Tax=Schistocephalus solidus TaxID=70667 RepID=A0A183SJV6_SCHSO|nr:unnamed protein product [Schistocephalus solidus]